MFNPLHTTVSFLRRSVVVALGGMLLCLAGCNRQAAAPGVLAKVGAREIRTEDFDNEVQWRVKNQRPLPDKQSLLEEMIAHEILLQKARAAGLESDPEVRRSYENLLAGKVQERELKPRLDAVKVSPEEIRALYEKNLPQNTRSAKARLALVYIKTDPKINPEHLAEAEARIQEAHRLAKDLPPSSRGFGQVAIDYSEDQASRYKGGDIGWFDQGRAGYRWPTEVISAGFALKANGEVSDVIRSTNGFYLVAKVDERASMVTPLEQVQASLQRRLLTDKRQEAEAAFRRETRAFALVQSFPQALAKVQFPAATMAKAEEPLPPSLPSSH